MFCVKYEVTQIKYFFFQSVAWQKDKYSFSPFQQHDFIIPDVQIAMTRQIAKLLVEEKGAETFFFWRKSLIAAEKQEEDGSDIKQLWVQENSNSQMLIFFSPSINGMQKRWLHSFMRIRIQWWLHPIFSVPAAGLYAVYTLYICEGSWTADFFLQDSELKLMQTFPIVITLYFCNGIIILGSSGISRPDVEDKETRE